MSVTEQAQDISTLSGFETGNSITITPNGPRQVTFSDLNGAEEIRQFDGSGRTVTVSDERGNFADMATGMVHTRTQNILLNQSFEDGTANWTINDASGVSLVTDEAYHGDKAVKIDANQTDSGSVMQSVTAPEAGAYTFFGIYQSAKRLYDSAGRCHVRRRPRCRGQRIEEQPAYRCSDL